jgi:Amt family ammonium transporter
MLLFKECAAILFATSYAFFFTLLLFKIINKFIPVKVTDEDQELGLDLSHHGEVARQQR